PAPAHHGRPRLPGGPPGHPLHGAVPAREEEGGAGGALSAATLPPRPFIYPVVDAAWLHGRAAAPVVAAVARGGARVVQVRAKALSDGALLALAREAVAAARATGA